VAFRTGILGYRPLKSYEVMLIGMCGGQCLNAN
jgi:hypothetical protein